MEDRLPQAAGDHQELLADGAQRLGQVRHRRLRFVEAVNAAVDEPLHDGVPEAAVRMQRVERQVARGGKQLNPQGMLSRNVHPDDHCLRGLWLAREGRGRSRHRLLHGTAGNRDERQGH